jgi:hypothetical protein
VGIQHFCAEEKRKTPLGDVLITGETYARLLDCDMDENRNLALHSLDIVKHWFNGGTSPVSMHEYIVEDSAQNSDGIANIDLGYQLA